MPSFGWRSPQRKSIRLDIPITTEQDASIRSAAETLGVSRTEAARELLDRGIRGLRRAGKL